MLSGSYIVVGHPVFKGDRYEIPFTVPKRLQKYFKEGVFWFECPDAGKIPDSLAVVPAVANLIPFAWVFDCVLKVDVLDEAFCGSIPKIKKGYIDMLPKLDLKGSLEVDSIVPVSSSCEAKGSPLMLFSGGVDAWCTLVRHVDEKPHLVSIWGADIGCDDVEGWGIVEGYSKTVADSFGFSYSYVKSNLKGMLNYRALDGYLDCKNIGYHWWHDLQHSIVFIGLGAPLAHTVRSPLVYIASSYNYRDKGGYTCVSDPTIDNEVAAGLVRGCHDGYELTRQDKVNQMVWYAENSVVPINLRVCIHVQASKNCCSCEKCGRTILGIYAAGGDPHQFGFDYSAVKLIILSLRMRYFFRLEIAFYRYIRESTLNCKENIPACFSWILSDNLEDICDNGFKRGWDRFHKFGANLYHKMARK